METREALELPSFHRHTYRAIPLRKIQELAEQLLHIGQLRKHPHRNGLERVRHTLSINTTPSIVPYNQKGIPNSQLLHEEQRIWTTCLAPQFLRLPLKREPLKNT